MGGGHIFRKKAKSSQSTSYIMTRRFARNYLGQPNPPLLVMFRNVKFNYERRSALDYDGDERVQIVCEYTNSINVCPYC